MSIRIYQTIDIAEPGRWQRFAVAMLIALILVGCGERREVAPALPQPSQLENARVPAAEESLEHRYARGPLAVPPNGFSDEFAKLIGAYRPESREARRSFIKLIGEMRSDNAWLDQSLDDPINAPMATKDGKNPGPNTHQRFLEMKQLTDNLLTDYQDSSDDSEADKAQMAELYQAVILDLLAGREPDSAAQTKIFGKFKAGSKEPLVLFMNLEYDTLLQENRDAVTACIPAALRFRKCSPETIFALITLSGIYVDAISETDRVFLVEQLFEALPGFLARRNSDPLTAHHAHAWLKLVYDRLNSAGKQDLIRTLLKLREGEGGAELVPADLLHQILAGFYWQIAAEARGSRFIAEVSESDLGTFAEFGQKATDHAIAAYVSAPEDPYLIKSLLAIQLQLGSTPYSLPELHRIAMMTQCDSSFSSERMAWAMMPRYGGSPELEEGFAVRLINQAMIAPDNQLVFESAMENYLRDAGWFSNIAKETQFGPAISRLIKHLAEINGGERDKRLTRLQAALAFRTLWDGGDLEGLIDLDRMCEGFVDDTWYSSRYTPTWMVRQILVALEHPNAPKDAIIELQRELIRGDQHYDEARWQRIDAALESLRKVVIIDLEAEPPDDDFWRESLEDQPESASLSRVLSLFTLLRKTMKSYQAGEQIDLINPMGVWTNYGAASVSFNADSIDVRATSNNSDLIVSQPLRFEMPFIVEMDVNYGECNDDNFGIALYAGQVSPNSTYSKTAGQSLRFAPCHGLIYQTRLPAARFQDEHYHEQGISPVPETATLKMKVHAGGVISYINDELITDTKFTVNPEGHLQFGRLCGFGFAGASDTPMTYKISSFRVKKWAYNAQQAAYQEDSQRNEN